jgi:hypothetical protein
LKRDFWVLDKKGYFLSVGVCLKRWDLLQDTILAGERCLRSSFEVTIFFIPISGPQCKLATDWAEYREWIVFRQWPVCDSDSISGRGRRRKQGYEEDHDGIGIRRGRCVKCGRTFTLSVFSIFYTHDSFLARYQPFVQRAVEHCWWEKKAPKLNDPDRLPNPLVERPGRLPTRCYLSQPDGSPGSSLAEAKLPASGRGRRCTCSPAADYDPIRDNT